MNKLVGGIVVAMVLIAVISMVVASGVLGSPGHPRISDTTNVGAAGGAEQVAQVELSGPDGSAMELMEQAAKDGKYFFGFFWKTEGETVAVPAPQAAIVPVVLLLFLVILLSFLAEPVSAYTQGAASQLLNPEPYIEAVLNRGGQTP